MGIQAKLAIATNKDGATEILIESARLTTTELRPTSTTIAEILEAIMGQVLYNVNDTTFADDVIHVLLEQFGAYETLTAAIERFMDEQVERTKGTEFETMWRVRAALFEAITTIN